MVTLLEPSWYDVTDLLEAATARAADVGASVVLYLPQDLGAAETRFVDALASVGDVVVLAGRTHVERADGGLPQRWQTPPLPAAAVATAHEVLNTSDSDDEVRCVVRDVVASLQETDADRIAVLYTADDPYAALLHDHLAAAGIRVNGTGSRPMIDRALPRAVLGLLALPEDDLSRSALFRILNGAPLRDFAGDPIPVAAWERASREAGVVRGADWRVSEGRWPGPTTRTWRHVPRPCNDRSRLRQSSKGSSSGCAPSWTRPLVWRRGPSSPPGAST